MPLPKGTRGYGETVLIPKPIRLVMVHLAEKNTYEGKEQGWDIVGLIPKDDAELLQWYIDTICAYCETDSIDNVPIHPLTNGKTGEVNDGDDPAYAEYPQYAGHFFFKATTTLESIFEVIGTEVEPDGTKCERRLATPDEIHAGCWAEVAVMPREWDKVPGSAVGKIKFYLQGVVKVEHGEIWSQGNKVAKNLLGLSSASKSVAAAANAVAAKAAAKEEIAPVKKNTLTRKAKAAPVQEEEAVTQEEEVEQNDVPEAEEEEEKTEASTPASFNPPKKQSILGAANAATGVKASVLGGLKNGSAAAVPPKKQKSSLSSMLRSS